MADPDPTRLFPSILPADEADAWVDEAEAALAGGDCPFCDHYDGEHPSKHAPKAHPTKWRDFQEARDG